MERGVELRLAALSRAVDRFELVLDQLERVLSLAEGCRLQGLEGLRESLLRCARRCERLAGRVAALQGG